MLSWAGQQTLALASRCALALLGNKMARDLVRQVIHDLKRIGPVRKLLRRRHGVENVSTAIAGRKGLFEVLGPIVESPVVFLGDSITAACEWRELFGWNLPILNRGIGGDTTAGVLSRLRAITAIRPTAIFLMIGTNDLGFLEPGEISDNIARIVDTVGQGSPRTFIYLQSILPSRSLKRNHRAQEVNLRLSKLPVSAQVSYLHLYDAFLDDERLLATPFTYDGLHLTGDGYLMWKSQIEGTVEDSIERRACKSEHYRPVQKGFPAIVKP